MAAKINSQPNVDVVARALAGALDANQRQVLCAACTSERNPIDGWTVAYDEDEDETLLHAATALADVGVLAPTGWGGFKPTVFGRNVYRQTFLTKSS